MSFLTSPEVAFALTAVRRAGRLVRQVQREMVTPAITKSDRSPVTVGDFAAQALVASLLNQHFPDDPLVAEESPATLRTAEGRATLEQVTSFVAMEIHSSSPEEVCELIERGTAESSHRFWTLDPIDGTKGFLRGGQYAVALALIEDGQVTLGALGCPELSPRGTEQPGGAGSVFVAAKGAGCWAATMQEGDSNFQRVEVAPCEEARFARLLRSVEAGHTDEVKIDELASLLGVEREPVRMDSQAKYAVLASGGGEVLLRLLSPSRLDYREKIWDQAAGKIVVEEAGGQVTDLDGKPLDFSHGRSLETNRGVLVTNRKLHAPFLAGLKQVGA